MDPTHSSGARNVCRDRAVIVDASSGRPSELATLWENLTSGSAKMAPTRTKSAPKTMRLTRTV